LSFQRGAENWLLGQVGDPRWRVGLRWQIAYGRSLRGCSRARWIFSKPRW